MKRPTDAGSALMLMPAAVLVLVVLGAVVVDSAVVFLAQRELANRTAGAANDAAAIAFDDSGYYHAGSVCLDPVAAEEVVAAHFAADRLPENLSATDVAVTVHGTSVAVEARSRVELIFARAIPGVAPDAAITAASTATVAGGSC